MKLEYIGSNIILNDSVISSNKVKDIDTISTPHVYEVIRVVDRKPLFLEEHLDRMKLSLDILNFKEKFNKEKIANIVEKLIDRNDFREKNIKIIYGDINKDKTTICAFFIESNYPKEQAYIKGVSTIIYESERENPNAKVINSAFKKQVNEKIIEKEAFEALLVNSDGNITEGSRSNFFFIRDKKIYTAPQTGVLKGVTRIKVVNAIKNLNIDIEEKYLNIKELNSVEGAFLTGTSIDALPISKIDDLDIESSENQIIKKIMIEYKKIMDSYINSY